MSNKEKEFKKLKEEILKNEGENTRISNLKSLMEVVDGIIGLKLSRKAEVLCAVTMGMNLKEKKY